MLRWRHRQINPAKRHTESLSRCFAGRAVVAVVGPRAGCTHSHFLTGEATLKVDNVALEVGVGGRVEVTSILSAGEEALASEPPASTRPGIWVWSARGVVEWQCDGPAGASSEHGLWLCTDRECQRQDGEHGRGVHGEMSVCVGACGRTNEWQTAPPVL